MSQEKFGSKKKQKNYRDRIIFQKLKCSLFVYLYTFLFPIFCNITFNCEYFSNIIHCKFPTYMLKRNTIKHTIYKNSQIIILWNFISDTCKNTGNIFAHIYLQYIAEKNFYLIFTNMKLFHLKFCYKIYGSINKIKRDTLKVSKYMHAC